MSENNSLTPGFGGKLKAFYRKNKHLSRLVIIIAIWMIFMVITKLDTFYTAVNFQTMGMQFPEFGLMSLGIMLTMITGGIDLSSVSIANLTAIISAFLMKAVSGGEDHIPVVFIPLLFVLAVIMGGILGSVNGLLVSKAKVPAMLATLGMGSLLTGVSTVITNGKAISDFPKTYAYSINNTVMGIPVQLIVFLVVAAVLWVILEKTTYGLKIEMIGSNQKAAFYSGIKVDRTLIKTYMASGICAALGGLIMLANYNSARADYGQVYTLQCILIVVLGGVNPVGGSGRLSGVVFAILLVRMLETGINRFPQISPYYISLIWGAVLILVMVLEYFSAKKNIKTKSDKRRKIEKHENN